MKEELPYYVYVIFDPRIEPLMPIYVGKGKGGRVRQHFTPSNHPNKHLQQMIMECKAIGLTIPYETVARFAEEQAAYDYESHLVQKYGRRDICEGSLYNLRDGGHGGRRRKATPEQRAHYRESIRRRKQDPKYLERCREAALKRNADPEYKKRQMAAIQQRWADPEFRAQQSEVRSQRNAEPTSIAFKREQMRRRNADPEYQNRRLAGLRRRGTEPDLRKWRGNHLRRLHADPEYQIGLRERLRKHNTSPESRERIRKLNADPEFQARRIAAIKKAAAARKATKPAGS